MQHHDVIILGAGAAGLMAGIEAGKRGRKVLVIDHAKTAGEKIRISGGGRCNFTNINATVKAGRDRFLSKNPRYALSALSRYTPGHFIALVDSYAIPFHEKTLGQLFCDGSSQQIINLLLSELKKAGGTLLLDTEVDSVSHADGNFTVMTHDETLISKSLIVATGGKSIPKMGATGLAYQLATQFGLKVTETRPALVPLTFEPRILERLAPLSGIAVDTRITANRKSFDEAMLFTHRGLSGPAILQVSSYWREGDAITIDLFPNGDLTDILRRARSDTPKLALQTVLSNHLAKRLAQMLAEEIGITTMMGDMSDKSFQKIEDALRRWTIKPTGSEGYRTAEVTLGGIDTDGLDSTTMAARTVPNLYFIGEAVDVTGWLGGYNFQWAWSSGWAAGQVA
ncbi:MAG: NAD(P)/FAD-dependent oxidoreductase [Devosia sp.]|uniref:NAD(P)/FAD-dependent oxidoreductase n=1 Tax=Devosia sp. TaxID=1871048 RepID=UPI00260201E3|nr:NAD(P)/FAD-dependent oxidoreductase [Devosia sp.]MDB5541343.1 NAD(P)/FAD-dependent oxidoreductase [Devosia sp.]